MLRTLAILFGVIFVIVGILGFLPDFTPQGKLLGLFEVNTMHNIVHIATGVIALLAGLSGSSSAKFFFIIFGLVYAAIAAWGFYSGESMLFGLIANNTADNWLHTGIAAVSLYIGFAFPSRY